MGSSDRSDGDADADPARAVERFRLLDKLGQGGMATVYRAEDTTLGRTVAVKILHDGVAERPETVERFAREARILAALRHPNVLQLFDYLPGRGEQPARLVMELLAGPSLQRFVVDQGAPLPEVAALVGVEIAAGLSAAHARGVVHRDVKPENVLLDDGRVVLTDFGIARVAAQDRSALTQTGAIIGSPAYMSPEQARGEEVDARSDQFSLGSLVYFLATGAVPFQGPHPLVVMQKIDRGELRPAGARNPRVPAWLDRVLRRCMARAPGERYADMDALAEALRRGLADDGLGDPAAELRRYFGDPPGYNAALPARVIAARLAEAERAAAAGERARAHACLERVLQLDPEHATARALVRRVVSRGRARWVVLGATVACFAAAAFSVRLMAPSRDLPIPSRKVEIASPRPSLDPSPSPNLDPTPRPNVDPNPSPRPNAFPSPAPRPTPIASAARIRPSSPKPVPSPPTAPSAPIATPPPAPNPAPTPTAARLIVRTAPWCDLSVDGRAIGRTPQSLSLPLGAHQLVCRNPSGASLERRVELVGDGDTVVEERLVAAAVLQPSLSRGDAVAIDDGPASAKSRPVAPGRRRVSLLRGDQTLEARWVDVPTRGCRLIDTPVLRCEDP